MWNASNFKLITWLALSAPIVMPYTVSATSTVRRL